MRKPQFLRPLVKNPREVSYEGKDNDEVVGLIIRRSLLTTYSWLFVSIILIAAPVFFIPPLSKIYYEGERVLGPLFLACFTMFWYIFTFGFIFQNYLDWFFEVLLITNKKLVDIDKACTNISETPLRNIQDITSKMHGVWRNVFNIGSIHIQTAAEREEFEFHDVDNPSSVRDTISDLISERRRWK